MTNKTADSYVNNPFIYKKQSKWRIPFQIYFLQNYLMLLLSILIDPKRSPFNVKFAYSS